MDGTAAHVPCPREAKTVSDKGDAPASIAVLDTRPRIAAGGGMNTGPLRIKGLAIRVPMHRELGLSGNRKYSQSAWLMISAGKRWPA